MTVKGRPGPDPDQMIVSTLHTVATRRWEPLTGPDREAAMAELRAVAGGRMDLVIQAAGVILGSRPPDEHDPRYLQHAYGAELLLELAGVETDAPEVQAWAAVGRERRTRGRGPVQHR